MRYFFDTHLPRRVCRALRELDDSDDVEIVHHDERYPEKTPDTVWMAELSDEGKWCVLTRDHAIHRNPAEVETWKESQLTVFFFLKQFCHQEYWVQAWKIVRMWPELKRTARRHAGPGEGYRIGTNGKIDKVY